MNKKILLLSSVIMIGLSSCRKDRTCTCQQNGTDLGSFKYTGVKRSEGKKYCQAQQATYSQTNPGTTCTLH